MADAVGSQTNPAARQELLWARNQEFMYPQERHVVDE